LIRQSNSDPEPPNGLSGRTVTLLETRRSTEMAALVRRYGGEPNVVPSLREVESVNSDELAAVLDRLELRPPTAVVFQTGVGVEYLFHGLNNLAPDADARFRTIVDRTVVIARGPKPTNALRQRGIRIDRSVPSPYTTHEVINELDLLSLERAAVLVIRHGGPNPELVAYLDHRGATALELEVYHWEMPEHASPLADLVRSVLLGDVDILMFTSASQVENLFLVAESIGMVDQLRSGLNKAPMVAAVGPVCAAALKARQVSPPAGIIQPSIPKMAPLVRLVAETAGGG
jgi:uroporphyrinogen-III synthase